MHTNLFTFESASYFATGQGLNQFSLNGFYSITDAPNFPPGKNHQDLKAIVLEPSA
jgi:hypothetical protein